MRPRSSVRQSRELLYRGLRGRRLYNSKRIVQARRHVNSDTRPSESKATAITLSIFISVFLKEPMLGIHCPFASLSSFSQAFSSSPNLLIAIFLFPTNKSFFFFLLIYTPLQDVSITLSVVHQFRFEMYALPESTITCKSHPVSL